VGHAKPRTQPISHPAPGADLARKRRRAASGVNCKCRRYSLFTARCCDPHLPTLVTASNSKKPGGHQQPGATGNRCVTQPAIKPCAIEMPAMAVRVAEKICFR